MSLQSLPPSSLGDLSTSHSLLITASHIDQCSSLAVELPIRVPLLQVGIGRDSDKRLLVMYESHHYVSYSLSSSSLSPLSLNFSAPDEINSQVKRQRDCCVSV